MTYELREGLSVTHAGHTYVYRRPIYGWAPRRGWRFGLGARTGMGSDDHHVDDLLIEAHGTRTTRLRNTPLAVRPASTPYLHTYSASTPHVTTRHTYLPSSCTCAQAGSAYRAEPVGVELTLNGLQFSDGGLLYEYEAEPVEAEVEAAPLPATE